MGLKEHTKQIIVQSNPSKQVRMIDSAFLTEIIAGNRVTVDVYSPAGFISHPVMMTFNYPAISTATTGTHLVNVLCANGNIGMLQATFPYNNDVLYNFGGFSGASTAETPTDKALQLKMIDHMYFDEDSSLTFGFSNDSNASDGGSVKSILLWVQEEKIS